MVCSIASVLYKVIGENRLPVILLVVYRQICSISETVSITIATSKAQVASIHNQLGEDVGICVEPYRRGTFSAVALAASWLYDVQKVPLTESIVVCPVDSYADNDFFETVKMIGEAAREIESGLILLGIEPTYPSEKYGYMIPAKPLNPAGQPVALLFRLKEQVDDLHGVGDDGQVVVGGQVGDHMLDRGGGVQDEGGPVVEQLCGPGGDPVLLGTPFLFPERQRKVRGPGILGEHDAPVHPGGEAELLQGVQIPPDGGFADIERSCQFRDIHGFFLFENR